MPDLQHPAVHTRRLEPSIRSAASLRWCVLLLTVVLTSGISPALAADQSIPVSGKCRWKPGPPVLVTDDEPVIEGNVVATHPQADRAVVRTRYGFYPVDTSVGVRLEDFSTSTLLTPGERVFLRPSDLTRDLPPRTDFQADDLIKDHYLDLEGGDFKYTNRQDLHHLFRTFEQSQDRTMVVYFHGGLVTRRGALDPARKLQSVFTGAGAYPVFFIWNSFWQPIQPVWNLRTVKTLWRLFRSPAYRKFLSDASADIDSYEAHRNDTGGPGALPEEKVRVDGQLIRSGQFIQALYLGRAVRRESGEGDPPAESGEQVWRDAVRRARERRDAHRDHRGQPDKSIDATVVEEVYRGLGITGVSQVVWERMKADTEHACNENDLQAGGIAFLKELEEAWQEGHHPRILLVGHSAGAIFICHLLQAAERLGLPPEMQFDVAFLAPACNYRLFDDAMSHHRVSHLWVFGMNNEDELRDVLIPGEPWLYPHSLLYFVSGVAEPARLPINLGDVPLVGMQRYFTGSQYDDLDEVRLGRTLLDGRTIWTNTPGARDGLRTTIKHHQDFKDDDCTLASLQRIIRDRGTGDSTGPATIGSANPASAGVK